MFVVCLVLGLFWAKSFGRAKIAFKNASNSKLGKFSGNASCEIAKVSETPAVHRQGEFPSGVMG